MTSLGAAYLAGLKCGYWKDKEQLKETKEIDRIFEPNMDIEERKKRTFYYEEAIKRSFKWNVDSMENRKNEQWWYKWKQRLINTMLTAFIILLFLWITGRLLISFA